MAEEIPAAIAVLIVCAIFFVLSLYFTEFVGAFYLEKGLPLVLFANEMEAIFSSMYALPEKAVVNFSGTNLCRWNQTLGKYSCADGLAIDEIGIATSHTTSIETGTLPVTACIFISIHPSFQTILNIAKRFSGKMAEMLAKAASRSTTLTRIRGAVTRAARAVKSFFVRVKAWLLEKLQKLWDRIRMKYYSFMSKIPYFGRKYKVELFFYNEYRLTTNEIMDLLIDELGISSDKASQIIELASNYVKTGKESECLKVLGEFLELRMMKRAGIPVTGYYLYPATFRKKLLFALDKDLSLYLNNFRNRLKWLKEHIKTTSLETAMLQYSSCRFGNWFTDLFVVGIFGMVVRWDSLISKQFYSRYLGKVGAIYVGSTTWGLNYTSDRLISLNGNDFCLLHKFMTNEEATWGDYKSGYGEFLIENLRGTMQFTKNKLLYDTLCSEKDKFYPDALESVVDAMLKSCFDGASRSLSIYLPPSRALIGNGSLLCEARIARTEDGKKVGEFLTSCIDFKYFSPKINCEFELGNFIIHTNYSGPADRRGDEYFDMWHWEVKSEVKFEFPMAEMVGRIASVTDSKFDIPVLSNVLSLIQNALAGGFDSIANAILSQLDSAYKENLAIEKRAYYQSRFDYFILTVNKVGRKVELTVTSGPNPCSYVDWDGTKIVGNEACQR